MPDGKTYKHHKYDNLVREQIIISYMSGGTISIQDIDDMCPYDRRLTSDTIKEIKEQEAKSYKNASGVRTSRTSRF